MCFSAGASFGASIMLGSVGVLTLRKVKQTSQVPFAAIPLMFAVQQVAEGVLWIGLSDPDHTSWSHFPVYIFLMFAQIIWPAWIPFSILLLEKNRARRRLLAVMLAMGLTISTYLAYCLFVFDVSAEIRGEHIHYTLNFPIPLKLSLLTSILYFIPTVISLFVSAEKRMWILGMAILLSFISTQVFFEDYVISVWCFFAAILSIVVLWITSRLTNMTLAS
jgi:hypothetical protein